MDGAWAADVVRNNHKLLMKIVGDFAEEEGDFRPAEGMMTVAQQIRHIGMTLDWFREGAFGTGFDLDFERFEAVMQEEVSLSDALEILHASTERFADTLAASSEAELDLKMRENPIFGPVPRQTIVGPALDHSAHHRGALSVYLRLLGKKPVMIYE